MRPLLTGSFLLAALLLAPAPARAQLTAREALQALERTSGPTAVANLVAVAGFNGQRQPEQWRLLTRHPANPDVFYEFTVSRSRVETPNVLNRQTSPDLPTIPLLTTALRIDSTDVFRIADDQAITFGVGFDHINYQLRWRGDDREPTWLASLVDVSGNTVGRVYILATTGEVIHNDFSNPASPSPASPAPANTGAASGDPRIRLTPVTGQSAAPFGSPPSSYPPMPAFQAVPIEPSASVTPVPAIEPGPSNPAISGSPENPNTYPFAAPPLSPEAAPADPELKSPLQRLGSKLFNGRSR